VGDVHIASALFFDIGVFTLVVGSTLLILTAIAHQSVRSHRFHARVAADKAAATKEAAAGSAPRAPSPTALPGGR
jgi:multicomponent K+:H+ antiporter subunit A